MVCMFSRHNKNRPTHVVFFFYFVMKPITHGIRALHRFVSILYSHDRNPRTFSSWYKNNKAKCEKKLRLPVHVHTHRYTVPWSDLTRCIFSSLSSSQCTRSRLMNGPWEDRARFDPRMWSITATTSTTTRWDVGRAGRRGDGVAVSFLPALEDWRWRNCGPHKGRKPKKHRPIPSNDIDHIARCPAVYIEDHWRRSKTFVLFYYKTSVSIIQCDCNIMLSRFGENWNNNRIFRDVQSFTRAIHGRGVCVYNDIIIQDVYNIIVMLLLLLLYMILTTRWLTPAKRYNGVKVTYMVIANETPMNSVVVLVIMQPMMGSQTPYDYQCPLLLYT